MRVPRAMKLGTKTCNDFARARIMTTPGGHLKPHIRPQRHGWAVEQNHILIGIEATFSRACILACLWAQNEWVIR